MKHSLYLLTLLVLISLPLLSLDVEASFTPSAIQVNNFNTASFDPVHPETQPVITTLDIRNNTNASFYVKLRLRIKWNGIDLTSADYISKMPIEPNGVFPSLSNRDLITVNASTYFMKDPQGTESITSLTDIINNSPLLESAVLSGFFPDGLLVLEVSVRRADQTSVADTKTFSINIRNAGVINLSSPGRALGQTPADVDGSPLTFAWNSINTNFNEYYLTIREFPPSVVPNISTVETMGTQFFTSSAPLVGNSFNEFLPFVSGNYYAWQVTTRLYDETNPQIRANDRNAVLKSNWFVFRYISPDQSPINSINELQAVLISLGQPSLISVFDQGFATTGEVIYNGRTYSGQEAIDLVRELIGREISIEILNQ